MNEISVSINKTNLNKILYYAKAAYEEHKAEIGGMAICIRDDENNWEIKDPIILKQEITGTNCALDKEELADYYLNVGSNKKYKNKTWRFLWWHSHHMMNAFWSGTDLNAIDEFSEGDLSFALVINLKGEYLVRASAWTLGMHQDMELTTEESMSTVPKKILEEVEDKCSTRTYISYVNKYTNQLSLIQETAPVKDKKSKEIEKFTEVWLKLVDEMDELIADTAKGVKTIERLKIELARMNGELASAHTGIRINYSNINTLDDLITTQPWEILEVDKKFSETHEELIIDAIDAYSWNWSYGVNRRYY